MHFLFIALVVIMAGTLLLAKTKKDGLGKFFSFIAWFNIIVGFLLFIFVLCGGACMMVHHCKYAEDGCKQTDMKCHQKNMKAGNCFFSKHFGCCGTSDENCKMIYIMSDNETTCDSMMKKDCMKECMKKPGCDSVISSCHKKMIMIKKEKN